MDGSDPHIHVQLDVIHADAAVRNMMASTFGLAGDLPSVVTTGCKLKVPYAMTSPRPESVTCLACREHAHRQHLRLAEEVERFGRMPGATISSAQATLAAERHRELAKRFADTGR
ncbi:hypothetical protein GCM10023196_055220 [Actinoallomurus vinaceus]|uniref:Uncharacterized protein n=1 Tax=Actinoallomurus vinaceus TaxID=1080074 RepID=A0ABP8UHY4_9ACTN